VKPGGAFEQDLQRAFERYRQLDLADIVYLPVPFTLERRLPRGRFQGFLQARQYFDFCGIDADGRGVALEAKQTNAPRLPLSKAGLKGHQLKALIRWRRWGAASWLLWRYKDIVMRIDPVEIPTLAENRHSIAWQQCVERFSVVERKGLWLDPLNLL